MYLALSRILRVRQCVFYLSCTCWVIPLDVGDVCFYLYCTLLRPHSLGMEMSDFLTFLVPCWAMPLECCGHNGESPPSFCDSLGIIYITSFQGRTIDLTTRDMGSELRYHLGKVLGTQNCPTLRLASSHCVLGLNPIKGTLNIVS